MTTCQTQPTLAIVTPCYNEQDVVELFYREVKHVMTSLQTATASDLSMEWQLLFVDDGSRDDTLGRLNQLAAEDSRVRVYSLSRNFGHQVALTAGLDQANADAVVMMDCDLQHPPALIPAMIAEWQSGADIVQAVRQTTADANWLKRGMSRMFYWAINHISDVPIVPGAADFCLLSRRAHQALRAMPERHRFLRGMVSWLGFPRAMLNYDAAARAAGESKYTLAKMWRLAATAVISFSATPLKMATRAGVMVTLLGLVYLAYVLTRFLIWGDLVPGWGSLMCTMLLLGGMQLFSIGLVGEYLARVFEEAKHRPLYFFKQEPDGYADTNAAIRSMPANGGIPSRLPITDFPMFDYQPLIR